jgi:multiple sugar transport system substrate-binding protein
LFFNFMKKVIMSKFVIIICIAFVLVSTGLGCKGLSQQEKEATKSVVLDYWTVFNDVDQLRALAEDYKTVRRYVTVNIRQIRYEEFDDLFTNALADNVEPDIVSVHSRWLRQYKTRLDPAPSTVTVARITTEGRLQPRDVVTIEQNTMPDESDVKRLYVSSVAEDVVIDGDVYGLPIAMDTLALYYNKELLDKAGVPLVPSTWEGFSEAVKKGTIYGKNGEILQSGVALGTGNNIDNSFDIISLLFLQSGLKMTKGGMVSFAEGVDKNSDKHPAVESLRFYTDFARPTKDVYSWNENMPNALEEFARGKSVFYFGFAYDRPRIKARGPQLKFEIEPVAQLNPSVPVNVANYWVESVVGKSEHKDEAWDFIRFLSAPENIKKYTDATKQPSPLRVQIESQKEDEELGPFALQALSAKNWYQGNDLNATDQVFTDLFSDYLIPFSENENPVKRAVSLLEKTSRVIQQTW